MTKQSYIRGLEVLGQSQASYSTLLVPIILGKLPSEIKRNLAHTHGKSTWLLNDLRQGILNEINIIEAGTEVDIHVCENIPTTSTFFTGSESNKPHKKHNVKPTYQVKGRPCIFCNDIHSLTHCTNVTDHTERMNIIKREKLLQLSRQTSHKRM